MSIISRLKYTSQQIEKSMLLLDYPMLNRFCRYIFTRNDCIGVIYMLHRISDKDFSKLPPNEDLKISPAKLNKIILSYKKSGFMFLSMDEVLSIIKNKTIITKPFVAFTIDDGYMDNYTNAYPIFKENNIPFCIYIATDFPDKKAILWWFGIEDIILNHDVVIFNGKSIVCKTWQQKWDAFRIMREKILQMDQKNLLEELTKALPDYKINWLSYVENYAMTWEQISKMSKDPLCTIGGHTISHLSLQNVNSEDAKYQIKNGDDIISSHINKPVIHFSLPYGREYPRTIDKELDGMCTMVYANGGCIKKNYNYFSGGIAHLPRQILK